MIPHDHSIEKSLLSLCFQQSEVFIQRMLGDGVSAEHFHHPSHKKIWELFIDEKNAGREVELVSFTSELEKRGELEGIGGASYLAEIYTYSPTSSFYSQHLDILRDRLSRRRLAAFVSEMDDERLMSLSPDELATLTKGAADSVLEVAHSNSETKDSRLACKEFLAEFESLAESGGEPGIQTGLFPIDNLTGGMRKGELWVVSGPTSGGKSVMSLQFASKALEVNSRVGVFSLEMGAHENIGRLISCKYGVDYSQVVRPKTLTKQELTSIKRGLSELASMPISFCDEAGLTIERIWAVAQQWHDESPLDLVIVDYIQLIQSTDKREARHEQLSHISGQLKQLAKKLKCPVVVPSQLNTEGRMAKAKSIGDDADVVLRIEDEGIYVLKNRNGQKHVMLPLELNGAKQRFETKQPRQSY